ncbi:MAG: 30S ribosomal protein S6 [Micropepsaceae bacterium]
MPFYEHVYVARQDATPQAVEALTEEIKATLEANGGTLTSQESWGLRTLTYRIKKNRKGHYVLLNIDAPAKAVQEVERLQKINEERPALHDRQGRGLRRRSVGHDEVARPRRSPP